MATSAIAGLVAAAGAVAIDARPAAAAGSKTFVFTGTVQYFTVPQGMTELLIEAWGAQGDGSIGGQGGYVRGFLPVRPGEGFAVAVGGAGRFNAGGWNGGGNRGGGSWAVPGGGGGASDVRRTGDSLTHRILVAGGGGGRADSAGGDGGYPAGTQGTDNGVSFAQQGAEGGYGGELTHGGFGGFGYCGSGGFFATGGTGATGTFAGGGGGGGYYGGGGGGAGCSWGGAGGGGGSSWTDPTVVGALYKTGAGYGDGKVVISWSPEGWPDSLKAPAGVADPAGEAAVDPLNHEAEVHDRTILENLGDSDVSTLGGAPYRASSTTIAAKEELLARLQPWVAEQSAIKTVERFTSLGPDGVVPCPSGGCPPAATTLTQPLSHQERNYWAGPATTQLVLQQMRGTAPTQTQLSAQLGTEKYRGTSHDAIAYALNTNLGFEHFYSKTLTSGPNEYLSAVIAATHYENHSVVNNIKTSALSYWGPIETTVPAKHYNISHGYSFTSGGVVRVAEQYDTTRVQSKRTINPYGNHIVAASEMYRAILDNKGIIVW